MDIRGSFIFLVFHYLIILICSNCANGKVQTYIRNYNGEYTKRIRNIRVLKLLKENEKEIKIVKFPDPVLRTKSEDVLHFDDHLKNTIRLMFDMLYANKGISLSAPQVNINKKIIVWNGRYEKRKKENEKVFINPTIVERSLVKKKATERCLSSPEIEGAVKRPAIISVSYFDISGTKHLKILKGLSARLFQHEYDHLKGILFFDKMTQAERKKVKARLNQLRRQYETNNCCNTDKCGE